MRRRGLHSPSRELSSSAEPSAVQRRGAATAGWAVPADNSSGEKKIPSPIGPNKVSRLGMTGLRLLNQEKKGTEGIFSLRPKLQLRWIARES